MGVKNRVFCFIYTTSSDISMMQNSKIITPIEDAASGGIYAFPVLPGVPIAIMGDSSSTDFVDVSLDMKIEGNNFSLFSDSPSSTSFSTAVTLYRDAVLSLTYDE